MKLKSALFLLLTIPFRGLACEMPPAEQRTPPEQLITRTKTIVLAEAIRAELVGDEVRYTFRTITPLKGTPKDQFQINGRPDSDLDFNNHFDTLFWENPSTGRTLNGPDCDIHPGFSVGHTYLIFLESPYHVKSFERITRTHGARDTKDKWLQFVENHIKP
jgi:hypothetical protein